MPLPRLLPVLQPVLQRTLLLASIIISPMIISPMAIAEIAVGQPIPALDIADKGELQIIGEAVEYQPWSSASLSNRVHTVQYMAGRAEASKINDPFIDLLKERNFPIEQHLVTTIVNLDDSFFGTSGFVLSELKKNKLRYPLASIIADEKGLGVKAWQLNKKDSAIIILSPAGSIVFFQQGKLSEQDSEQALALIAKHLQPLDVATAGTSADTTTIPRP